MVVVRLGSGGGESIWVVVRLGSGGGIKDTYSGLWFGEEAGTGEDVQREVGEGKGLVVDVEVGVAK